MIVQGNFSLDDEEGIFSFFNTTGNNIILTDEIQVSVGTVMIMENIISIILLSKCCRLPFQIRILTLNLALSDILTGLFLAIPNAVVYDVYQCDIKKYPCFLFINVSLLIVTMMNLDRCFAFAFTMRYYSFITEKLIIKLCICSWTVGFVLTYDILFGSDINLGLSCEIMAYVKRNIVNMTFRSAGLCIVVVNLVMFGYLIHHIRGGLQNVHDKTDLISRKQSRTVRKISVFTVGFLAAFFPFLVVYTFPIFDFNSNLGKPIYGVTSSLVLLNSACNPIFYVWRFKEPRYHMKKILCFWNENMINIIDRRHNQKTASYDIYVTPSAG